MQEFSDNHRIADFNSAQGCAKALYIEEVRRRNRARDIARWLFAAAEEEGNA